MNGPIKAEDITQEILELAMEDGLPIVRIDAPDLSPQKLVRYEHWKGQAE